LSIFLLRTSVFMVGTFFRFVFFIGLGLIYCYLIGIECLQTVPGSLQMLVVKLMPATAAGFVTAILLLRVFRGWDAVISTRQSAMSAMICAVILDGSYLFGTDGMRGMVVRRSVQLVCAFLVTLGLGLYRERQRQLAGEAVDPEVALG
jgi:hypothetical protein